MPTRGCLPGGLRRWLPLRGHRLSSLSSNMRLQPHPDYQTHGENCISRKSQTSHRRPFVPAESLTAVPSRVNPPHRKAHSRVEQPGADVSARGPAEIACGRSHCSAGSEDADLPGHARPGASEGDGPERFLAVTSPVRPLRQDQPQYLDRVEVNDDSSPQCNRLAVQRGRFEASTPRCVQCTLGRIFIRGLLDHCIDNIAVCRDDAQDLYVRIPVGLLQCLRILQCRHAQQHGIHQRARHRRLIGLILSADRIYGLSTGILRNRWADDHNTRCRCLRLILSRQLRYKTCEKPAR